MIRWPVKVLVLCRLGVNLLCVNLTFEAYNSRDPVHGHTIGAS